MPLESIRTLVQADLDATDQFISGELLSDIPLINKLTKHIFSAGGKRIRPMLALLSANTFGQPHQQQHIFLAAAIELIHTATLLHDDVVDSSTLRRGNQTANDIWGNEASVLVGDFLYSRAFQLVVGLKNFDIIDIFAAATHLMAEGEVMQLANCHDPDVTEESYYDVIHRKTAKLFEIASHAGALLSQPAQTQTEAIKTYGIALGTAYQLIDDAMDYHSSTNEMGKNTGDDLAEGKPTLPLIYAMQNATTADTKILREAICTGSRKNLKAILSIIESTGAIQYTAAAAKKQAQQAIESLSVIPESPYRQALTHLAEFVVSRTY
ncbi:MAG: polyprenyl synthetase family protein [Gammaproteobacteria bacterium]|nr:polyprenyl synthetase family protein [Gammaproteobacteria bacterium]